MSNAHRLDTAHSEFYADVQRLIESPCTGNHVIVTELCQKYGIAQETLYWRIRSYYGKGIAELRREFFTPSREALLYVVKRCSSSDEVRAALNIPSQYWQGIYDRVLGVATFQKAKLLTVEDARPKAYNPSTKDNVALVAATILGDGHYDAVRGAIRIEHGPKQGDWLKAKVELFRCALPYIKTEVTESNRGTFKWYSGRIKNFDKVFNAKRTELPEMLTPLGVWLYFLDDGTYSNTHQQRISFAPTTVEIGDRLIEHLRTYGFDFKTQGRSIVNNGGQVEVKRFLNTFGMPFYDLTPECMRYKIVPREL